MSANNKPLTFALSPTRKPRPPKAVTLTLAAPDAPKKAPAKAPVANSRLQPGTTPSIARTPPDPSRAQAAVAAVRKALSGRASDDDKPEASTKAQAAVAAVRNALRSRAPPNDAPAARSTAPMTKAQPASLTEPARAAKPQAAVDAVRNSFKARAEAKAKATAPPTPPPAAPISKTPTPAPAAQTRKKQPAPPKAQPTTIKRSAQAAPKPAPVAPTSTLPAVQVAQPIATTPTPPKPVENAADLSIRKLVEGTAWRIEHRAALISTFAALNSVEVAITDVAEFMWLNAHGDVSIKTLALTLANTTGIKPRIQQRATIQPSTWPAMTMMQGGHCVLVISQTDDTLVIYDTTCPDNRAEVPVAEFAPVFTGTILTGRASLKQIADRHLPQFKSAHWFWGEFPKYRKQVTEIMLGSFVANILAVAVALFSLQVYDRVIPHQSVATLWVLAIGAFLAIALEAVLKLALARLTDSAGRQIELSIQRNLMSRLLGMRSDKKPLAPSGLIAAMREFGSVREFFTSSTIATMADVPFIAIFLLLVASIAGNLVWVIVAGGILMLLPAYFMQKKMIALTRQTQGASVKMGRMLHEVVTELDTVKTQRGEERVLRHWDELYALSSESSAKQRRLSGMLTFWSQGIQQATYIIAVVVGDCLVFAGEFTVDTIIATGILTSRTLAPLTQFAATVARWSNVKNALEGLDAIAFAPQKKDEDRTYLRRETLTGRYEMRDIEFRYDEDGAPTLELAGIAVTPGQRVAVLGANGSGKSTLLKLMSGLNEPTKGRVLIDGTDMTQIDPRDLRRGIGFLGQDVRLMAGTLRDNLNFNMLERDDDRLMDALEFAGLGPFVRGHHKGLDLEIRDAGEGLSIGQRQSIGWARLWLQNPTIVLLDEPTAAMDQALETDLVARLNDWLQGRTAVIATHRQPILSLTDRVLILQSGRMVVDGPREQVLAHLAGSAPQ